MNRKSIVIKPFKKENQEAVQNLILAGLSEHWGKLNPALNADLNDICTSYADATFLVAWLGDHIVGVGALIPKGNNIGEIVRMSVAENMRRQGIATKILEYICEEAQKLGFTKIVLETTSTWHDVITFYQNFGFQITHRQEGEFGGETHFAYDLSEKTLGANQ